MIWILIAALAALAYIRFAPSDIARWHIALLPRPSQLGAPNFAGVTALRGGAVTDLPMVSQLFDQVQAIAAATPRTRVLAMGQGHITWITRSKWMGFPDYTTAQLTPDGVTLFARLRFGGSDFGVNAARLAEWRKLLVAP
jgi:hypothetical protein